MKLKQYHSNFVTILLVVTLSSIYSTVKPMYNNKPLYINNTMHYEKDIFEKEISDEKKYKTTALDVFNRTIRLFNLLKDYQFIFWTKKALDNLICDREICAHNIGPKNFTNRESLIKHIVDKHIITLFDKIENNTKIVENYERLSNSYDYQRLMLEIENYRQKPKTTGDFFNYNFFN